MTMNEEDLRNFMTLLHKWRDLRMCRSNDMEYKVITMIITDLQEYFFGDFQKINERNSAFVKCRTEAEPINPFDRLGTR